MGVKNYVFIFLQTMKLTEPIHLTKLQKILLFGGLFFVFIWMTSSPDDVSPPKQATKDYSNTAKVCAKNNVKSMLTSPTSAKFPLSIGTTQKLDEKEYIVHGSVEAQNALGVMLKNDYLCNVSVIDVVDCNTECRFIEP